MTRNFGIGTLVEVGASGKPGAVHASKHNWLKRRLSNLSETGGFAHRRQRGRLGLAVRIDIYGDLSIRVGGEIAEPFGTGRIDSFEPVRRSAAPFWRGWSWRARAL